MAREQVAANKAKRLDADGRPIKSLDVDRALDAELDASLDALIDHMADTAWSFNTDDSSFDGSLPTWSFNTDEHSFDGSLPTQLGRMAGDGMTTELGEISLLSAAAGEGVSNRQINNQITSMQEGRESGAGDGSLRHYLEVDLSVSEWSPVFYKDTGGRDRCICIPIKLLDQVGELVNTREVPLMLRLRYEDGTEAPDQGALVMHSSSDKVLRAGRATIKCRIEQVSRLHQNRQFQIQVLPDTAAAPACDDVGSTLSPPLFVRSKAVKSNIFMKRKFAKGDRSGSDGGGGGSAASSPATPFSFDAGSGGGNASTASSPSTASFSFGNGTSPVEVAIEGIQSDEDPQTLLATTTQLRTQLSPASTGFMVHGMRILDMLRIRARTYTASSTIAAVAPEEQNRVPMIERGVSLTFLCTLLAELESEGRGDIDCGQLLNGIHTTSSETDWKEFDRDRDDLCLKACCLHTGTSFVETCLDAGIMSSGPPSAENALFGTIDTFISYTWRGEGISLRNLVDAICSVPGSESNFVFIDVFVCAQHRNKRPVSKTCPNKEDVGKFNEVISRCSSLLLFATPITSPKVVSRIWCLYEIMSALVLKIPVTVILSVADEAKLGKLLAEDFDAVVMAVTKIDARAAKATFPSDEKRVRGWIVDLLGDGGFHLIDKAVADSLRMWLARTTARLVRDWEIHKAQLLSNSGGNEIKAQLLSNSAQLLWHFAKYDEAEDMYRRALAIDEQTYGCDHPEVAKTLNNLANVLGDKEEYAEAEHLYYRALAIGEKEKALGASHVELAGTLSNLGHVLRRNGKYDEAEAKVRDALAIQIKAFGGDGVDVMLHVNVAKSMITLAGILKSKGRDEEAESLLRRALAIEEKELGVEHPEVALTLDSIAIVVMNKGDFKGAEGMARRALAIKEKVYGCDHPEVGSTMNALGRILLKSSGKYSEAVHFFHEALSIVEKARGVENELAKIIRENLAEALRVKATAGYHRFTFRLGVGVGIAFAVTVLSFKIMRSRRKW